ncbi:hypothetical protein ACIBQ1_35315 [Nonomuraea sp. NPDC050153]|uniref:hypothetical protein n=1 Tax=Nonomuraea sp. NPDC050153 TaxID=3364359 RepID=UPI00378DBCC7
MRAEHRVELARVALVGIDGSGKSTCARLLAGLPGRDHIVLSCLRPHENPGGPLHELSRHLDTLSAQADLIGSPDLKLAVLYLQMCTYAVAERHFLRGPGRAIVTERHPLIDALTYLPLYRDVIERTSVPGRPAALREQIARMPESAVEAALAWCERLGRRPGGRAPRLDTLGAELVGLLRLPPGELIAELSDRFAVAPPDVAILLDIDVTEATRRVRARDRRPEPHERPDLLARIRDGYEEALKALPVRVHRVRVDGRSAPAVTAEIARLAAL